MWKVVLLEQAEEKPEACVLVLFVLPFQTGCLADRQHKGRQGQATGRGDGSSITQTVTVHCFQHNSLKVPLRNSIQRENALGYKHIRLTDSSFTHYTDTVFFFFLYMTGITNYLVTDQHHGNTDTAYTYKSIKILGVPLRVGMKF